MCGAGLRCATQLPTRGQRLAAVSRLNAAELRVVVEEQAAFPEGTAPLVGRRPAVGSRNRRLYTCAAGARHSKKANAENLLLLLTDAISSCHISLDLSLQFIRHQASRSASQ